MGLKIKLIFSIGIWLYMLAVTIYACIIHDAVGAACSGALLGIGVWIIYEVVKWEVEHPEDK